MTATTLEPTMVEATLQYVLRGKVKTLGTVELEEGKHFKLEVNFQEVPCNCEEAEVSEQKAEALYGSPPEGDEDPNIMSAVTDPGETSGPLEVDWTSTLESLLPGTVVADKDHDDWTKTESGDWQHKNGPRMRSKTLLALWAPFTLVSTPGATP